MDAVIVDNITKTYGKERTVAVSSVSFTAKKGELFGLIGPDGAGKTSIFRILTTLLVPDSGIASVDGFDIVKDFRAIRDRVGYMPGKFSLYQDLTVEENLSFFATVFGSTIKENYELIKDIYIQIEPFKNRRAGKLSGGMKQKLALCCALIHKPSVLFLDEPTTGVDPVSRKEFWQMLRRLKEQGITIIASTPYMDEATLCDRIALIQNGRILSVNSPGNLIHSYPDLLYAVKSENIYLLINCLKDFPDTISVYAFGEYVHLAVKSGKGKEPEHADMNKNDHNITSIGQYLSKNGFKDALIKKTEPTIEDCFIKLLPE